MTEKKSSNRGSIIGLSIVIIILLGYIGYLYFNNTRIIDEKVQLGIEKNEVLNELESLQIQFDTLSTSNDTLQAEISAQQQKIEEMLQ